MAKTDKNIKRKKNVKVITKSRADYFQEKMNSSSPFIITIRNLTDEKLFDVKLLDYEHEKQKKIGYFNGYTGTNYNDVLRYLQSARAEIYQIYQFVSGDYQKFLNRQLHIVLQHITYDCNRNEESHSIPFLIDPYQMKENCSVTNVKDCPISFNSNLILSYLMPEVEVKLMLFPSKIVTLNGK